MGFEPVFPLKAVVFQILFLLVAIAIEAGILRQQLQLSYQKSIQYATTINLLAVVTGWFTFLLVEPLIGPRLQAQIMSYIFFDRLMSNSLRPQMGWIILIAGFVAFFTTLLIKLKGLELLMRLLGDWNLPDQPQPTSRRDKYKRARLGRALAQSAPRFSTAVLRGNALSFSAILLLLLLRTYLVGMA
jgi:hypothetical protein